MVHTTRQAPVSAFTLDQLIAVLDRPDATTAAVAEVVESDPGLLARTLGLANSAYYGVPRTVADAGVAIGLVGRESVRTLAISGVTGLLDGDHGLPGARDHAIEVATAARLLAGRAGVKPALAFTAGLLHDIGELLLWNQGQDEYVLARSAAVDAAHQFSIEVDLYGTDHALLAAEHLFEWRLPDEIIEAVGDHHDVTAAASDLTVLVAAADELATPGQAPGRTTGIALGLLGISPREADRLRAETYDQGDELQVLLAT